MKIFGILLGISMGATILTIIFYALSLLAYSSEEVGENFSKVLAYLMVADVIFGVLTLITYFII